MKTSSSIIHRIGLTLVAIAIGAGTSALHAQPGTLDTSFNATVTIGLFGLNVAEQSDGKIVVCGGLGVVRVLADGSADPGFNPPVVPGQTISAIALQPDGKVFCVGYVTNAAGQRLPLLFRLHPDGALDPTFQLPGGFISPSGNAIKLQADGKLLTGAVYFDRNNIERSGLARLLPDGSLDPTFDPDGSDGNANIYSIVPLPDGRIYFANHDYAARLHADGTRDQSFNPRAVAGIPGVPATVAVQPDGKVLLGYFEHFVRLFPDGSDDPTFRPVTGHGSDAQVHALLVQPDGRIIVGGSLIQDFGGVRLPNVGRLYPDGSLDSGFDTASIMRHFEVIDMATAQDGKILIAGTQLIPPTYELGPSVWRLNGGPDRRLIEFTALNYIVHEKDRIATITVRRSGPTDQRAAVRYEVRPGTARFGRDYIGFGGVLVFLPGDTQKSFHIRVKADHKAEGPETVQLRLVKALGADLGAQDAATLTILDE